MLQDILMILLGLVIGLIGGFLISKKLTQKFISENPPINEKMIETLMSGMGRKPSQKQINQMMREINRLNK